MIQRGAMQKLSALIAEIEAGAYARGRSDARKALLDILGAGGERASPAGARRGKPGVAAPKRRAGGSKRAPRGSVPRFVEQALRDNPGSTVQEILGLAATDGGTADQAALDPGRIATDGKRKQGRYESRGRRWSLAASASTAAGEDGSSGAPPEAEPERGRCCECVGRRTGIAGSPIPRVGSRRKRKQGKARPDLLRRSRSTGDGPARGYFPPRSRTTHGRGPARPGRRPPLVSLAEVPSVHTGM